MHTAIDIIFCSFCFAPRWYSSPLCLQSVIEKPITEWFNVKCHKIYCHRYLIDGILLFFFYLRPFLPKSIFHSTSLCILLWQHKNSIFMTETIIMVCEISKICWSCRNGTSNITHVTGQSKYFPPKNNDFCKD